MLRVNLTVASKQIVAVIDTGAKVSIISDKIFESMQNKPPVKIHTAMHGVGRNMKTFIIGPVDMRIGTNTYSSEIYVAPMDDDILLGLNFLRRENVVLDCSKRQITINSDLLQLSFGRSKE